MEARQTIRLFFVLSSVTGFGASFFFATYVMFLNANHLNPLEVNLVNFFFYATIFCFEIPTGAVADIFGRKPSYVISCFLLGISFLLYAFSDCFIEFVASEIVGAVAVTFCSGAFEAWLVDRLKSLHYGEMIIPAAKFSQMTEAERDSTMLTPILSRESQFNRAATLVGAVFGAWLSDQDMRIPWIVAGLMQFLVGAIAIALMKEDNFKRRSFCWKEGCKAMKKTMLVSAVIARRNKVVRFVIVIGILQAFALQAPNMQWQPFFARFVGQQTTPLGFVYAGISLALIAGAAFTKQARALIKSEKKILTSIQFGVGLGIAVTAYLSSLPLALTVFLLHEVLRGMFEPIKDAYLNAHIRSSRRATVISFTSMSRQIGGMAGLVGSGLLALYVSIPFAWVVSGTLLIIATVWLMRNGKA